MSRHPRWDDLKIFSRARSLVIGTTVLRTEITAFGYFRKMEANIFEKTFPGEFRWYGLMMPEETDDQGSIKFVREPRDNRN